MSAVTERLLNKDHELISSVNHAYSTKSKEGTSPDYARKVAESFGYNIEELNSIPDESHLGLSCGNPTAAATLKPGETVLDLGSGGGIDVFLAAAKVGTEGHAIGLDMSTDMIQRARSSAKKRGLLPPHVAFVQASLAEQLPIRSSSVDCVLSNCVLNLLPPAGKKSIFKEVWRALKPGGRVVLDDIIIKQELPANIKNSLAYYVGCIAGAMLLEKYKALMQDAGFGDPVFVDSKADLNVYTMAGQESGSAGCCGASVKSLCGTARPDEMLTTLQGEDLNTLAASYQIYAMKPESSSDGEVARNKADLSPLERWWDAFPSVVHIASILSQSEVEEKVRSEPRLAIIDVRGDDEYAGGHIHNSINAPAQTFHNSLASFHKQVGGMNTIVFYCGSSTGRAPRCAGWYLDYLISEKVSDFPQISVLEGGMKGWVDKHAELHNIEH